MFYNVIQVFVPSILTVMMSWLSFWINIESVPARINLGLLRERPSDSIPQRMSVGECPS